jgi:hypothetical protein
LKSLTKAIAALAVRFLHAPRRSRVKGGGGEFHARGAAERR